MTEIKRYRNKDLLNRLSEMQRAPYYATACQTLVQAEMAIVALEDELRAALAQENLKLQAVNAELTATRNTLELTSETVDRLVAQQGAPVAWVRKTDWPEIGLGPQCPPDWDAIPLYTHPSGGEPVGHWTGFMVQWTGKEPPMNTPLFLQTQPAREPMTPEQIDELMDHGNKTYSPLKFARAVEAHHGIKGATE